MKNLRLFIVSLFLFTSCILVFNPHDKDEEIKYKLLRREAIQDLNQKYVDKWNAHISSAVIQQKVSEYSHSEVSYECCPPSKIVWSLVGDSFYPSVQDYNNQFDYIHSNAFEEDNYFKMKLMACPEWSEPILHRDFKEYVDSRYNVVLRIFNDSKIFIDFSRIRPDIADYRIIFPNDSVAKLHPLNYYGYWINDRGIKMSDQGYGFTDPYKQNNNGNKN